MNYLDSLNEDLAYEIFSDFGWILDPTKLTQKIFDFYATQ